MGDRKVNFFPMQTVFLSDEDFAELETLIELHGIDSFRVSDFVIAKLENQTKIQEALEERKNARIH